MPYLKLCWKFPTLLETKSAFTDIVGSTRLLQELGQEVYRETLGESIGGWCVRPG